MIVPAGRAILFVMLVRRSVVAGKEHKLTFYPDFISKSVTEADFRFLKTIGIKACLIDLDGTVVSRGEYEVDEKIRKALKLTGMKVYIATNRTKNRSLKNLQKDLSAKGVIHPKGVLGKPTKTYYRNAIKKLGFRPNEVVMIGDRYIQDILGANRAGLYTLLVHKLGKSKGRVDELISEAERKFTMAISPDYTAVKVK